MRESVPLSLRSLIIFVLGVFLQTAVAEAADKVGVVLMHGEQGAPGRVIDGLGARLDKAGYLVSRPDMCWSARRSYESDFPACLDVLDDAIVKLRNIGATRIVVGGFSLGGAVAIVYGAAHPDLLGVFALAPTHDAAALAASTSIRDSVGKAQALVAQGKADDEADFEDVAIGPSGAYANEVATTPNIYLSFFGPDSPVRVAPNVAKLKSPLFWAASRDDPTQTSAKADFAKATASDMNRFVELSGSHQATPEAASGAVLEWLGSLTKE
jgi:dienelactone hydrolase